MRFFWTFTKLMNDRFYLFIDERKYFRTTFRALEVTFFNSFYVDIKNEIRSNFYDGFSCVLTHMHSRWEINVRTKEHERLSETTQGSEAKHSISSRPLALPRPPFPLCRHSSSSSIPFNSRRAPYHPHIPSPISFLVYHTPEGVPTFFVA